MSELIEAGSKVVIVKRNDETDSDHIKVGTDCTLVEVDETDVEGLPYLVVLDGQEGNSGFNSEWLAEDQIEATTQKLTRRQKRVGIYASAVSRWGAKAQIEMLLEESLELALATRKFLRKGTQQSESDLAEGIADVEIMIEQIKEYAGPEFKKRVAYTKRSKLRRLQNRIKESKIKPIHFKNEQWQDK